MPVGKLTPDGEITLGSRHGAHKGGLGTLANWDCPACGVKNEGRRPEQGCAHCGSGDPTKGQAGSPKPVEHGAENIKEASVRPPLLPKAGPRSTESSLPRVESVKVYRLIEYVMTDPGGFQETLRRSLVGTMQLPWGSITGTIVDSLDDRQMDLLRMARMQPGVWLGNATLGNPSGAWQVTALDPQIPLVGRGTPLTSHEAAEIDRYMHGKKDRVEPPDTGPQFSEAEAQLARTLLGLGGLPFIHTLALALSNVAMELEGNMEPLKFMESAACLRLANALMDLIPGDWDPQPEEVIL